MKTIAAGLLTVSLLVGLSGLLRGSAMPSQVWIRTFDDGRHSAFLDMTLAESGSLVVVGTTNHRHMPPYEGDALLMAFDLEGDTLWENTWGGDGYEQAWGILPAGDGFYVFGETDSYGAGDRDFFLLRATADGEEVWFHTYGTAAREWPYGILQLANGELFLYGMSRSTSRGDKSYAVRVGLDGGIVWEYASSSSSDELVLDALETDDGRIILCLSIDEDGGLRALAAAGAELWSERYRLNGWQFATAMQATESGYLLAGFAMQGSGSQQQADVWLAETDTEGQPVTERSFGEPTADDYAQALSVSSDGTYLIAGLGRGMPLFNIDRDGSILWEYRLEDMGVHAAEAIIELADGGLLICGMKQAAPATLYHGVLLRLNAP